MRVLAAVLAAVLAGSSATAVSSLSPSDPPLSADAPLLEWEVISRRPHDPEAFTQGLVLADDGRLFESTGLYGASTVREVDPASGEVVLRRPQPDDQFGEGLALVEDELIQLTWRSGVARRYDQDGFEVVGRHRYDGDGWGLCYDGARLVMSDGSERLTFRDPLTFEELGFVTVSLAGMPLDRLNELECVDGVVWSNGWLTDRIVRIDPLDGRVTGLLDLDGIIDPHPTEADSGAVLNGIAHDAASGTFLVTGKRWPELIEIRISEPA